MKVVPITWEDYKKLSIQKQKNREIYYNINGSIIYKNQLIGMIRDNNLEIWNENSWIPFKSNGGYN